MIPREQNMEADALCEDFSMFAEGKRIEVDLQNLDFTRFFTF